MKDDEAAIVHPANQCHMRMSVKEVLEVEYQPTRLHGP